MAWVETPQETFEDSVCAPMPHASSRSVAASHLADERPAHWDGPQRSSAQGSITQDTPEQYVRKLESKVNRLEGETQELAQKNARLEQRVEEREVAEPKLDSFGAWAHAVFAGDGDGDGLDSRERAYFERHRNNMEAALADALREVVRSLKTNKAKAITKNTTTRKATTTKITTTTTTTTTQSNTTCA